MGRKDCREEEDVQGRGGGGREGEEEDGWGNAERGREEQSQKRYMVSGSLWPLISFLDVSYSVSFVVRG